MERMRQARRWIPLLVGAVLLAGCTSVGGSVLPPTIGGAVASQLLFAISISNNITARTGTYATVLAEQKMEQLRGLTWGFDILGLPISDSAGKLFVFTVTTTSASQALGSPYSIGSPRNIIVQPK